MKKHSIRLLALLLAAIMVMCMVPASALGAVVTNKIKVSVTSVMTGDPGDEVKVKISLDENPGWAGIGLDINYDETLLKLKNVAFDENYADLNASAATPYRSPQRLAVISPTEENKKTGLFAELTFIISSEAKENTIADITITAEPGNTFNGQYEDLELVSLKGKIIIGGKPGDVNGDSFVNAKDAMLLFRYVAHWTFGENVVIVEEALDCNGDNSVTLKDPVHLFRYIAGWKNIFLYWGKICKHNLTAYPAKAATDIEEGNIAYWYCSACDRYYSDAKGTNQIELKDTVIPPLGQYEIEYNIDYNDSYLKSLKLENPNPSGYRSAEGLVLNDLKVEGYNFLGWFTAQEGGEKVTEIARGSKGKKVLYAHWSKIEYTIQFDSPDVPVPDMTYTIDKGRTLINPECYGYTFIGWSQNGRIIDKIEKGTPGPVTVHANWTSNRNKAMSKPNIGDDMMFAEDMDNGRYLFTYELGHFENVPLKLLETVDSTHKGYKFSKMLTKSTGVDKSFMETAAETVSNATTKSSGISLSEEWNDTVTVTNEKDIERGTKKEVNQATGEVVIKGQNISNSTSGFTQSVCSSGGSSSSSNKVTMGESAGISGKYSNEVNVNTSVETNVGVEASVGVGYGPVEVGCSVSTGVTQKQEVNVNQSCEIAKSRNISREYVGTSSQSMNWNNSNTSQSGWNNTNSYNASREESSSTAVSEAVSNMITDRNIYSNLESYKKGTTNTASTSSTSETASEYASTMQYSTAVNAGESTTVEYILPEEGNYRVIETGVVRVFAVVGYDIATSSYFMYTYNILEQENRNVYLDYSKDTVLFDDCENGILPFEIPYVIHEYVSSAISKSDDFEIDRYGTVTKIDADKNNQEGRTITIPEYMVVNNMDGTASAVKVKAIAPNLFSGHTEIKGVFLPKYISEIPAGSFKGCTNLEAVLGYGITSIRDNAFEGCVSLRPFLIDKYVSSIGKDVFINAQEIEVRAGTSDFINNIVDSGAGKITLNISDMKGSLDNSVMVIPSSVNYFAFINDLTKGNKEHSNFSIESRAAETYISNMKFLNNTNTPLKLDSSKVTLVHVSIIDSPEYSMILNNENTELSIYDETVISSASKGAIIGKNIKLVKLKVDLNPGESALKSNLEVYGNILAYNFDDFEKILNIKNGQIIIIDETEFNNRTNPCTITFDANEGNVSQKTKVVHCGENYGELPTPVREHYKFLGWFTEHEGGTEITSYSKVTAIKNETLYAHWKLDSFTVTFNANGGSVNTASKTVTAGEKYGKLPVPSRSGFTFEGWYNSGGQKVTESTAFTCNKNHELRAHWLSGWVRASAMPSGAQEISSKWTYTQRSYTSSGSSSKSGWTKYDTKRTSWSGTHGPVYSNPSNGSRKVWDESYETDRTHHWVYYRWRNPSNDYGSDVQSSAYNQYQEFDLTYELTESGSKGVHGYGLKYWHDNQYDTVWFAKEYDDIHYGTRWYYQDPVYTYYFYKDENKESSSDPSGRSNVSDVVKYVRYRIK